MDLSSWILFCSIISLASLSPGPNVLAVIVQTIESGIHGAFYTILGNLMALFSIALVAAIGVGTFLQTAPSIFVIMKLAGGSYLVWIGIKMIRSSFSTDPSINITSGTNKAVKKSRLSLITQAMLISYSNPKSILFLSAVFPTFLDQSASVPLQFSIMFVSIIFIVSIIHSVYAILAVRMKGHFISLKARKLMAHISGVSFIGFGSSFIYTSQK